ncbi:Ankyrin repeat protein [uncultured virus]|nr:Ankyrin repeat protein [uncultured virus]
MMAAREGLVGILTFLLEEGSIDPNAIIAGTYPPLIHAIRTGQVESVRVLLADKRVDVNIYHEGHTPLMWAIHQNDIQIVELLVNHPRVDLLARSK